MKRTWFFGILGSAWVIAPIDVSAVQSSSADRPAASVVEPRRGVSSTDDHPEFDVLDPRMEGEAFRFDFLTELGTLYGVESRDDLATGTWRVIETLDGTGSGCTAVMSNPAAPAKLYRACTNPEILTGATLTSEEFARLRAAHRPSLPFDQLPPPAAPDYASPEAWAASWPGVDPADVSPPNTLYPEAQDTAPVDVFFVHPTCYAGAEFWNGPIDDPSVTGSVDDIMMYLASAFNAGARVYALRYRQFTLFAVIETETMSGMQSIALADSDVARAFDYYIDTINHGRPFILAGHSQGSIHGGRLLQEKIVGTPLQARLVAAYLIGMTIPADLPGIGPSLSATNIGGIINWNSYAPGARTTFLTEDVVIWVRGSYRKAKGIASIQTNPLTWELHGGKVDKASNPGSLPADPSGALPPLVVGVTGPDASGAVLIIDPLEIEGFPGDGPDMPLLNADKGDYHNYDYQLFYESIRKNVIDRGALAGGE